MQEKVWVQVWEPSLFNGGCSHVVLENLSGREKIGMNFEEAEGELGKTSSTEAK